MVNHVKNQSMNKQIPVSYLVAGVLFTTCLLLANILAVKIITIGPWAAPAGILVFPVAYIVNDVIAEVWGYRRARLIIWLGFAMNVLMVGFFTLAIYLPGAAFWTQQEAFSAILGSTPRLVLASLAAYLTGSLLNAWVLSKMKVASQGRNFGVRAVVSTLAGESADSLIFILVAFAGLIPLNVIALMIVTQALLKTLYEVLVLPLTAYIVRRIKASGGEDVYDTGISYSPF